jgi:hypothetical protein
VTDERSRDLRAETGDPVDWQQMAQFMRQMIVALDGLWFLNVLKEMGDEKAFELDVRVFVSHFKKATRAWREMNGLDGKSTADKVSVFQAMAHLFGHRFEVFSGEGRVTMRLTRCSFLENLKRAGRTPEHDCRRLCSKLGPAWFAEIEPRTGGAGSVDLTLPVGGDHCDFTVDAPDA